MRKTLLKGLGLMLALVYTGTIQAQETDVTENIYPTVDVQLRSNNGSYSKADGTTIEMYTTVDADGNITADFMGLMSFSVPAKTGYKVKSATLRLVTERKKNGSLAIYDLGAEISSSDSYSSQQTNIEAAVKKDPIAKAEVKGVSGRASFDSQAEGTSYENWLNEIDLTSYIKTAAGGMANLILRNAVTTTGTQGINVYANEASSTTIAEKQQPKFTFEEDALRPMLTVVYEIDESLEKENIFPTVDVQVRSDSPKKTSSDGTAIEMRTTLDADGNVKADFMGLMSFNVPLKPGYKVASATLRLVTERKKQGSLAIFDLGAEISSTDNYSSQQTNIEAAVKNDPIAKAEIKGVSNCATFDGNAANTSYEDWCNEIDLTSFIQQLSGNTANLILRNAVTTTGTQGINVYTDEATATKINSGKQIPKFTFEENDLRPMLTIVYKQIAYDLTVDKYGAATLVLPYDTEIPDGAKAYVVTSMADGKALAKEVVSTLPANTPVYVTADQGTYTFKATSSETDKTDNPTYGLLTGVYEETDVPVNSYILWANDDNAVGFYQVTKEGKGKVAANRAYLTVPSSSESKILVSFDTATGISQTETVANAEGNIYTVSGVRVKKPLGKGIYIMNGKKMVVR